MKIILKNEDLVNENDQELSQKRENNRSVAWGKRIVVLHEGK